MTLFHSGRQKNPDIAEEVVYANFATVGIVAFALLISLLMFRSVGWSVPVYSAIILAGFISLTLWFNRLGYTTLSRLYLSLFPTIAILAVVIINRALLPVEVQRQLFDSRVLLLGVSVLPLLVFRMSEWPYFTAILLFNVLALYNYESLHVPFTSNDYPFLNDTSYISPHYYFIVLLFIVSSLLIFKIRLCRLNKSRVELLDSLEQKIQERTRELTVQAEELIKSNNELEQFSFTVSHNIRGPVARLLGLLNLMNSIEGEEREAVINKLGEEVVSLDNIITDLNDILQIRKNLYKVKETIDIANEVKLAQQLLGESPQKICCLENMEVDIKAGSYYGVREYMQSILYHLIGNAFKYKKEGVDLKVKVKTHQEGDQFVLRVCDNGKGIDLNKVGDSLFKMYSRFDLNAQGKGIGLYLVKKQVEAMNGTIDVQSRLNEGTTFTIRLPVPESSQIRHQVVCENDVIKIVHDEAMNLNIVVWQKNLNGSEFRKTITDNLENALQYPARYWVNDINNFYQLRPDELSWFNEHIMPRLVRHKTKGIVIISQNDIVFKSKAWRPLKIFCVRHNIVFAFKRSMEDATRFITSLEGGLQGNFADKKSKKQLLS